MMRHSSKEMRGFTLIEVLVVISIIAIMATFASLGMEFIRKEKVSSVTKDLVSDLQRLRIDALTQGPDSGAGAVMPNLRGFGMRLASTTSYVTFPFNDADSSFTYTAIGEEVLSLKKTKTVSSSIKIEIHNLPEYPILIYDRMGVPTRYMSDGTAEYMTEETDALILKVQDVSGTAAKCVKVTMNSIRQGAWNDATSSCTEQ
jgi:prepilin-type N-terminal cleavage/methylation domain-containing protein